MKPDELNFILEEHSKWLIDNNTGKRANLSRADLTYANLSRADLTCADLSDTKLTCADLTYAKLSRADLSYANLTRSDLFCADLTCADLSDTNLSYASLYGANLTRSDLTCADLTDAVGVVCLAVGDPRGYRPIAVQHSDGWRIASGCRWFTTEEAKAHWSAPDYHTPHLGAQYVAAIDALPKK